jgi:hypothetical protein
MDTFTPGHGPILVDVELSGPVGTTGVRLILDTGATTTMIKPGVLISIGYDPELASEHVAVTMVEGVRPMPRLHLNRLTALGHHRLGFAVISHSLQTADGIQGLLGLDFFLGTVLAIDFREGRIDVS